MKFLFEIFLFVLVEFSFSEIVSYDNYQVYRVTLNDTNEIWSELSEFQQHEKFSFERDLLRNNSYRITVPPEIKPKFDNVLLKYKIKYEVLIKNLQSVIDAERDRIAQRNKKSFDWFDYHPLSELYSWLYSLQRKYRTVKVVKGGRTFEGRDIKGIQITNGANLPGVVLESGIHAREWITIAGTSWMVNEILKSREPIWKRFNYLYLPSYNPDGYVFTWTRDRYWRKTRTVYKSGNKTCHGADANRNWDAFWGVTGSTHYPCSDTYAGPRAFSEMETKTISQYLHKQAKVKKNKIYINYHSYSQLLMFPYGHTDQKAPLHDTWQKIGDLAGKAYTSVHGTGIRVGQIYTTVYPVSGDTASYYYAKLNASIAFSYEMRDQGEHGFILPPDQIIPVGEEHFASLRVILQEYLKYFGQGI